MGAVGLKDWKYMKTILLILMFLSVTVIAASKSIGTVKGALPTLSINPATLKVNVGAQFAVDVDVDYVENLYAFEVWISFDTSILRATSLNYTGYLNEPTLIWYQEMNNTGGYVTLAVSSHLPAVAKTGGSPPPLVTFYFQGIKVGTSKLHLYKTILVDNQANAITHQTIDSEVQVEFASGHDVAITSVNCSRTSIPHGYNASIRLSVEDQGGFGETFNVTTYANNTVLDTQTVTLASGESENIAFTWNTSGFALGNYTMSAYAWPVSGEVDLINNNLTANTVKVTIPGDLNGDFQVNLRDLVILANAYGSKPTDAKWNPNADIDGNGVVGLADLVILAQHYAKHFP